MFQKGPNLIKNSNHKLLDACFFGHTLRALHISFVTFWP